MVDVFVDEICTEIEFCFNNFTGVSSELKSFSCLVVKFHCVKIVKIRSFFWSVFSRIRTEYGPNAGKYGPEKTPCLDTFHAVFLCIGWHFRGWNLKGNISFASTIFCWDIFAVILFFWYQDFQFVLGFYHEIFIIYVNFYRNICKLWWFFFQCIVNYIFYFIFNIRFNGIVIKFELYLQKNLLKVSNTL